MTALTTTRGLRRGVALTGVAAVSALTVAACGSSSGSGATTTTKQSPKQALQTGIDGLQNANALTYTLKTDLTGSEITALGKASGDAADDQGDAVAAKVLPGGSIVFAVKTGDSSFAAAQKDSAALSKLSLSVDVNAGSDPKLAQLVYTGKKLYARAAVKTIAGYDTSGDAASSLKDLGSSGLESTFPFIGKAVDGDWLALDPTELLDLAKAGGGLQTPNPSQQMQLQSQLIAALTKDTTVTRAAASSDKGDHLIVTGNARTVGTDVLNVLKSAASGLPGGTEAFKDADPSQLPDQDISLDAYVKGGILSELDLDVTKLPNFPAEDKAAVGGSANVEIDFAKGASISAPSDATTVTTSQLIQLFQSAQSSGGASSSADASGF